MLVLTRAEIAGALSVDEVIDAVEDAFRAVAQTRAVEGLRVATPILGSDAVMVPMTGAIEPLGAAGLKLLTDAPGNPGQGRPRQQSVILLLDPVSHAVEALLDGAEITRLRTAAASAVATRHLSRPDSSTLGLIGAGSLAHAHLAAIAAVRPIRRVLVWSRSEAGRERFAAAYEHGPIQVLPVDSVEEVVASADVLCTLTPARDPIVRGVWLPDGAHVNAVGAPPRPEYREIDADVVRRSRVVLDNRAVALSESGAIVHSLDRGVVDLAHLRDELGQVVTGQVPGRTGSQQVTLYISVGLGIQDLATARLLVDRARILGLGTDVALTAAPVPANGPGPDRPSQTGMS
jgi:alanine dehydrogenase